MRNNEESSPGAYVEILKRCWKASEIRDFRKLTRLFASRATFSLALANKGAQFFQFPVLKFGGEEKNRCYGDERAHQAVQQVKTSESLRTINSWALPPFPQSLPVDALVWCSPVDPRCTANWGQFCGALASFLSSSSQMPLAPRSPRESG